MTHSPPPSPKDRAPFSAPAKLHKQAIAAALAPYDPVSTTFMWFDTLRAVEECINLVTVDFEDERFFALLASLPVRNVQSAPEHLRKVRAGLAQHFNENFANRFTRLLIQGGAIAQAFAVHAILDVAAAFESVETMIGYLQSRRRHFVALLSYLPEGCRGRRQLAPLDTFNVFLPLIEGQALPLMATHYERLVQAAREALKIPASGTAPGLAMLDSLFLEPERASIVDMPQTEAGIMLLAGLEPLRSDRLFSAAELRNDIRRIRAAYDEFGLDAAGFAPVADFVEAVARDHIDRDYWITVPAPRMEPLVRAHDLSARAVAALCELSGDFMDHLASHAPFVKVGGEYRSTVALLSRFVYFWRDQCLARRKRFQIRAGFIFEQAVGGDLERAGFVLQGIKRINNREFDVVATLAGVTWNFQCKNNFADLEWVTAEPQRFARYNLRLVRAYERALAKEKGREDLLRLKLPQNRIEHRLISKFPVVTDNRLVIPYSRLGAFAAAPS